MTRILIFGSAGQVARELARAAWPKGTVLTMLGREVADLSRPQTLAPVVLANRPDLVVIAAAYTKVDDAEDDEETATVVNGIAPGAIAGAAAELSAPVVHFSTDYVFDGTKGAPYEEGDATGPINAYGRSKLRGEAEVRAANPRHLILRTSGIYSAFGRNFVRTMLRLSETRAELSVVADQRACPTAAPDFAAAVVRLVPRLLEASTPWGTYHLAGATATSWFGFAEAIFAAAAELGGRRPRVEPVSANDYPTGARRPPDSRLSSAAFERVFGFALPGFEEALPPVLREAMLHGSETAREAS